MEWRNGVQFSSIQFSSVQFSSVQFPVYPCCTYSDRFYSSRHLLYREWHPRPSVPAERLREFHTDYCYSSNGDISNTWFISPRSLYSKMELVSVRCLRLYLDPQFKNPYHNVCERRYVECGIVMVSVASCCSSTFGIPSRPHPPVRSLSLSLSVSNVSFISPDPQTFSR